MCGEKASLLPVDTEARIKAAVHHAQQAARHWIDISNLSLGVKREGLSLLIAFLFATMATVLPSAAHVDEKQYETPGTRQVSDILPADMVIGPHYRVREDVVSYGYMYHFTVDSDFGTFEAVGDGALRKLIKEINAIAVLREIKKSKAYGESLKDAAKGPYDFGKGLITKPVGTVTGVPKGVFRLLSNAYTGLTKEKDPSEDSWAKEMLAVSSHKREYAHELGVDVYSSNAVLQEELNSLAWAGALGSLSLTAALAPFGGPVLAVRYTSLANKFCEELREEPPSRLHKINSEKLSAMDIPEELANKFLDHPAFTPRHDTVIVGSLEALTDATGRGAFLEYALSAEDEEAANFVQNIAETMRGYNETVSPIKDIRVMYGFVFARAEDGSVLIPFPVDHAVWTEHTDRLFGSVVESYKESESDGEFELWVTGTITPMTREQLRSLGVEAIENVDERIEFMD